MGRVTPAVMRQRSVSHQVSKPMARQMSRQVSRTRKMSQSSVTDKPETEVMIREQVSNIWWETNCFCTLKKRCTFSQFCMLADSLVAWVKRHKNEAT